MTDHDSPAPLLLTLIALTMVSGLIDAVCYLGLGHVFTANMTGNVVVLGFAVAGAAGFSVPATLTSLALFLAGAFCVGRFGSRLAGNQPAAKQPTAKQPTAGQPAPGQPAAGQPAAGQQAPGQPAPGRDPRRRLLTAAVATEVCFVGAAALTGLLASHVSSGWARYVMIALLAFGMGVRNATVRRLAVPDMTTTVLTMTLTGLAADWAAGGQPHGKAEYRRLGAVAAMLAGAIAGAAMYLHEGTALPLFVAALAASGAGAALWLRRAS
jgi:uncharacterized membrane protein YoaK (UPF0700 family)